MPYAIQFENYKLFFQTIIVKTICVICTVYTPLGKDGKCVSELGIHCFTGKLYKC